MATALDIAEPVNPGSGDDMDTLSTHTTPEENSKRESQYSTDSNRSWTDVEQIIDQVLRDTNNMVGEDDEVGTVRSNSKTTTYVQQQAAAFDYFQKINGVQQLGRNVPGSIENESSSDTDEPENLEREHLQLVERLQELAGDMFLVDDMLLEELMDLVPVADRENLRKTVSKPSYPIGENANTECQVCFENKDLKRRPCCGVAVCSLCLVTFIKTQVSQGVVKITCVECSKYIPRDEIMDKLDKKTKQKFYKFLVDANKEPHIKTCPRCSHIMELDNPQSIHKQRVKKYGLKVYCESCSLEWCFPCQAPWHEGVTCAEYTKGDKLLKVWAKEHQFGQANAQKCPKCKVYIQRSTGCDHMTCSRCKTSFCYKCGERFRELRFIGDHYSKLSVFGCKYRFKPHKPAQRRLIRGAILGGKIMAAPVIGGLALGAGAVLLGVGVIVLPFYGSYKLHNKLKQAKQAKRNMRYRIEWMRRIEEMRQKGETFISGPVPELYDYFDEYDIPGFSTRRQSVDLNVDSTSIDSETLSFCSHTELEDTLAVAQVDAHVMERLSTSSENSIDHMVTAECNQDGDGSNKHDSSLYYDASGSVENVLQMLDGAIDGFTPAQKCSNHENPAGRLESMQTDGPKAASNKPAKHKLTKVPGESSNATASGKSKLTLNKLNCYKPDDVDKTEMDSQALNCSPGTPYECIGSVELKRKSIAQIYV